LINDVENMIHFLNIAAPALSASNFLHKARRTKLPHIWSDKGL
jgi:hypothetical protein